MHDRIEKAVFAAGFCIGIGMGIATLAVLLLKIAPAFKGIKL